MADFDPGPRRVATASYANIGAPDARSRRGAPSKGAEVDRDPGGLAILVVGLVLGGAVGVFWREVFSLAARLLG